MQLQINGEHHELPDGISVLDMLNHLGFGGQRVAVEVNQEIVPRSTHADHQLKDGDQAEIVRAIGGG